MRCHSQSDIPIVGRKNYAISYVDDQIFVTGGMDNGHKLLSEFIILDPLTGEWIELKQTRNKNKPKFQSNIDSNGSNKLLDKSD